MENGLMVACSAGRDGFPPMRRMGTRKLSAALAKGLRPSAIATILTQLGFYVTRHFAMEEQYMQTSSYPGLAEQLEAHRFFDGRFAEIQEDFTQNALTPGVVHAIKDELNLWIKTHVLGLDQAFGAYYNYRA